MARAAERTVALYVGVSVILGMLTCVPAAARATDTDPNPTPPPVSEVARTTGWYADRDADTISIYMPPTTGEHPTVVFVHGGGWGRSQPNAYELSWARDLATQQDWVVAVIGYPTKINRAEVVEPRSIALALRDIAQLPGVDPRQIALWGESAGGQLALLTAYRGTRSGNPLVAAAVSISGPTDMRTEYASLAQTALGAVTRFEGLSPRAARRAKSPRYRNTSPLDVVAPDDPPTFQAVSRSDQLVPAGQVMQLTRALAVANVVHRTIVLPGRAHSTALEPVRPPGSQLSVEQLAVSFLTRVFDSRRVSFG